MTRFLSLSAPLAHAGSGAAERRARRARSRSCPVYSYLIRYCCIDLQLAGAEKKAQSPQQEVQLYTYNTV